MKPRIFLCLNLLAMSVSQAIQYFQANCFTFLTKFWMLQVRKSCSCGICAIFFQCCFMTETQVLITASDFSEFFSRNHFLEGGFALQWRVVFQLRSFIFKWGMPRWGGGASVLMGRVSKTIVEWGDGGAPMPPLPP